MQPHMLSLFAANSAPATITKPDATPYIQALLEADGQIRLAAERMHIPVGEFLLRIAQDPDSQSTIEHALRIFSTIKLFETLGEAKIVMQHNLSALEPFEASKTFTNICQLIEIATRNQDKSTNINVFDLAMRSVPPEIKQALEVLAQQSPPSIMTIDHEDTSE